VIRVSNRVSDSVWVIIINALLTLTQHTFGTAIMVVDLVWIKAKQ
jgi:hypothetical protein